MQTPENVQRPKQIRTKPPLSEPNEPLQSKPETPEPFSSQRSLSARDDADDAQIESKRVADTAASIESAPSVGPSRKATAGFYLKLAKPRVTYTLIALNVLVFLAMIVVGVLYFDTWRGPEDMRVLVTLGAKVNDYIVQGETWRLMTATFLHIGAIHLLFNLYALYAFGPMVEGYFGHARFLAIYIIAGLLGSIASFAFSSAISAGASGAVFGLAGAIIVYFLRYRDNFGERGRSILQSMLMVIGINLVFGLSMPGIDNWGHIGGLVGGAVAAWGLLPKYGEITGIQALPQAGPQVIPEENRTTMNIGWVIVCGALLWTLFQSASQITPLLMSS